MKKVKKITTRYLKNIFNPIKVDELYNFKYLWDRIKLGAPTPSDVFDFELNIQKYILSPFSPKLTEKEFDNLLFTSYHDILENYSLLPLYESVEEKYIKLFKFLYEKYKIYLYNEDLSFCAAPSILKKYRKSCYSKFLIFDSIEEFINIVKESIREIEPMKICLPEIRTIIEGGFDMKHILYVYDTSFDKQLFDLIKSNDLYCFRCSPL